jgi:hypothetical protein
MEGLDITESLSPFWKLGFRRSEGHQYVYEPEQNQAIADAGLRHTPVSAIMRSSIRVSI